MHSAVFGFFRLSAPDSRGFFVAGLNALQPLPPELPGLL